MPTTSGWEKIVIAITAAIKNINKLNIAAGGPRRDWNNLSEINPPAKAPTMPKMHKSRPQLARMPSAPTCFTSCANTVYHCMIPLRSTPEVSSTPANINMSGL